MEVGNGDRPKNRPYVNFFKYFFSSLIKFIFTMVIGVFLANVFAHYGGYTDELFRGKIANAMGDLAIALRGQPMITPEEGAQMIEDLRVTLTEQFGLNEPYWNRFWRYYFRSFILDWGEGEPSMQETMARGGPYSAREALLRYLPGSMLLFTTSNLLTFFVSLVIAANISKKPDSIMNKVIAALAPIFSVPAWIFGLLMFYIAYYYLHFQAIDVIMPPLADITFPKEHFWLAVQGFLTALCLPVLSIFLSTFLQSIYVWRNFFMSNSAEDYVELAKAKGLPARIINRRYIIRPTLPPIITSFVLTLLGFWQTSIAVEKMFYWPGIGRVFLTAVSQLDREMVMCIVVVFAYLLGSTIFVLDIVYALVDPRIRIGNDQRSRAKVKQTQRKSNRNAEFLSGIKTAWEDWWQDLIDLPKNMIRHLSDGSRRFKLFFKNLIKSKAAVVSLTIVVVLISLSVYIVISLPLEEAEKLWRTQSEDTLHIPELAQPTWTNIFRKTKLPESVSFSTTDGSADKSYVLTAKGNKDFTITFEFDYLYQDFPQDLSLFITPEYGEKPPFDSLIWITPDGREIELANFAQVSIFAKRLSWEIPGETRYLSHNEVTNNRIHLLLGDPEQDYEVPLTGRYQLQIKALFFEEDVDLEAEFSILGQVYGWAGTDNNRRDLMVPLSWGLPIALMFGITGTLFTNVFTMWIAAISAWFGGTIDNLLQRITDVNMILPVLPGVIMFYYIYSKSVWVILGVLILLNIFSSDVKTYRASFLQDKESDYIEAAQAYGAKDFRIIARYLIPQRLPILIPKLIISVPIFMFYEATLAFLGVSGFYIPTWGKIIYDGIYYVGLGGYAYWLLEPAVLFLIVSGAFTMLGLSLEKIFNNNSLG